MHRWKVLKMCITMGEEPMVFISLDSEILEMTNVTTCVASVTRAVQVAKVGRD